ncbi:MAG: hypothetical protein ABI856_15155 [Nitrospira sp.]
MSGLIPSYLRLALFHILALLVVYGEDALAFQIEPNPNPFQGTISVTTTGENLVEFSNQGTIDILTAAKLKNTSVLNNSGTINMAPGAPDPVDIEHPFPAGELVNEGTIKNLTTGQITNSGTLSNSGTIENQGAITGPGLVSNAGTVTNSGTFIQSGYFLNLKGATLNNDNSWTVNGILDNAGHITNNKDISVLGGFNNGSHFEADQPGSIINNGTITISSGAVSQFGQGFHNRESILTNYGALNIAGGFTNNETSDTKPGMVISSGTITVEETGKYLQGANGSTRMDGGIFTNRGSVQLGQGSFFTVGRPEAEYKQETGGSTQVDGRFTNQGTVTIQLRGDAEKSFTVGSTGEYVQKDSGKTQVDGSFTNHGRVTIESGGGAQNSFTVSSTGEYVQGPTGKTQVDGKFSNEGRVTIQVPTTSQNAFTVGSTGQYNQSSVPALGVPAVTVNNGTFTNEGAVRLAAGTFFANTGQYNQSSVPAVGVPAATTVNSGTFTNVGTTVIGVGTFVNDGSVRNSGEFRVAALGQVTGVGTYEQTAMGSQTVVNGTFGNNMSIQAGSLSGTGTITGMVTNTGGVVQPGSSILPGTLTLASYTQGVNGRLDLKIGGLLAGSQYDVLKVNSPAVLNGSVFISLINGFVPKLGDTFDLIRNSGVGRDTALTLNLQNLSLPSLPAGEDWIAQRLFSEGGGGFFELRVTAKGAEPGTLLLLAPGFAWLLGKRWRRRQILKVAN